VHRYDDAGHYVVLDAHERILPSLVQLLATRRAAVPELHT
jgi:hypothetical protein